MPGGEEDDGDSVLSEDGVSSGGHESMLELWTSTGRSLAVGAGGPSRDVLTLTEGRLRMTFAGTSLVVHLVKSMPAAQEVQVPSLGRADPLEEGNGSPLQHPCLEHPTGRGAWWAAVRGVTESQTRLSD